MKSRSQMWTTAPLSLGVCHHWSRWTTLCQLPEKTCCAYDYRGSCLLFSHHGVNPCQGLVCTAAERHHVYPRISLSARQSTSSHGEGDLHRRESPPGLRTLISSSSLSTASDIITIVPFSFLSKSSHPHRK